MAFLRAATQDVGANVDAATHLHQWVSENPSFEDIVYREYWLPTVPPIPEDAVQTEREKRFYRRMKQNVTVRMILHRRGGGHFFAETYYFPRRVFSAPDAHSS